MISRKRSRAWMRTQFGSPMGRIVKRRRVTTRARAAASRVFQAPLVNRIVRKLRKQVEVKEINTNGNSNMLVGASGTWAATGQFLLNPLAQGTTKLTRIGDKINMKDLLLRYRIERDATETNGFGARVVIFLDRKTVGGVAPVVTDLFLTDNYLAPLNRANAGRFAILHDEFVSFDNDEFTKADKIYLDLKRTGTVHYGRGNAGTVADITTGALWLWINCYDFSVAGANVQINSRVKFSDQ